MTPQPPDNPSPRLGMILSVSLIAAAMAFLVTRNDHDNEPLQPILLATGEWAPYSSQNSEQFGIASAIVNSVFQQLGYQPELRFMAWEPAEASARQNQTNDGVRATFPYGANAERARDFYYSDPLLEIEMSLYYNRIRFPQGDALSRMEQLGDFRVLPIQGYRYPADLASHSHPSASAATTNVDAFRQLVNSAQPSLVVEATRVGSELLDGPLAPCRDWIGRAPLTFPSPIHLIASKRNPHNYRLIRDFNRALAQLKQQGAIAAIAQRVLKRSETPHQVLLSPWRSDADLHGWASPQGNEFVLLPRGSRAVVEHWGAPFLQQHPPHPDAPPARVQVRLLNGPLAGQTYYVDGRSILLPEKEHPAWPDPTPTTNSANPSTRKLCSPPPASSTGSSSAT